MIVLNGKKFAKNAKEFTDSLFQSGGTCVGYYKRTKGGNVRLYDQQHNLVGCVTTNKVLACATKLDNGKVWYSHADIDLVGRHESYQKRVEEIEKVLLG